jgi:hypothetical protein
MLNIVAITQSLAVESGSRLRGVNVHDSHRELSYVTKSPRARKPGLEEFRGRSSERSAEKRGQRNQRRGMRQAKPSRTGPNAKMSRARRRCGGMPPKSWNFFTLVAECRIMNVPNDSTQSGAKAEI